MGIDEALPEAGGWPGVFHTRSPEGSDQPGTPRPNPIMQVGLAHKAVDLAERRLSVTEVEEDVGPPADDRRRSTLLSL